MQSGCTRRSRWIAGGPPDGLVLIRLEGKRNGQWAEKRAVMSGHGFTSAFATELDAYLAFNLT